MKSKDSNREIKRNYWADGFDMYSMQYNEL